MIFEEKIKEHARENPKEEVCGVLLMDIDNSIRVERMKNESDNKQECFHLSPQKFLEYKINNRILGVYHSHPKSTETPSRADKLMSEELGLPYLVYSLKNDKFFLYYPESYEPHKLISRPYVKCFHECICIWKDYYNKELGINITNWNKNYWLPEKDNEANKLLMRILEKNAVKREKEEIKKNDILVFELKKGKRLHVGVAVGEGEFIHQPINTLSRIDALDNRWGERIKHVFRHPSLV